jgi:hypothetical protein
MAGWPLVTQSIDRVATGQPRQGLCFVLHSTADIDYSNPVFQKPDAAVWTEMPNAYLTAKRAFEDIGMKAEIQAGTAFPAHTVGIYFGIGTTKS